MSTSERVAAVRAFNRFYTGRIGLLRGGMHRTAHTLTEARVLFELGTGVSEVADLRQRLDLDGGQLSRVLAHLEDQGLITRERAPHDARRQLVRLTPEGDEAFGVLDARSAEEIDTLLDSLPEDGQRQVVGAFGALRRALDPETRVTAQLRGLQPGDLGWHVERHGAVYSAEYGWDQSFERLCAGIVAAFDPERDAAWIAELDGQRAGGVLCIHEDDATARLRLLLVEPAARGHGLGTALVEACVAHARARRYARLVLWTMKTLADARRVYERAGFTLDEEAPTRAFGHDLVEQTWSLTLKG